MKTLAKIEPSLKSNILVVEKNKRNVELLSEFLSKLGFCSVPVSSSDELNKALSSNQIIDVALIDIDGFDETIWNYCKKIREKEIQFLIISPRQRTEISSHTFNHGASGVLSKPLVMKDLANLIINLTHSE